MSAHIPRKRFGQHFLHDRRIIKRIIDSLNISETDRWVEIGPGQGALTNSLANVTNELILIEIDRDLADQLHTQFKNNRHVRIINEDILNVDISEISASGNGLRLVGNLPYNISTPIFFHLAQFVDSIVDMTFMIQKEVADRLTAGPGNKTYGRLTVTTGLRFQINRLFDVNKGAFNPPPKVQSSVIQMIPHELQVQDDLADKFDRLVKSAFLKRRKILKNSLYPLITLKDLDDLGIDPDLRGESLSINDFLKLAQRVL